jgi:hypothetical protein
MRRSASPNRSLSAHQNVGVTAILFFALAATALETFGWRLNG